jgi:AbrB family looped-hinge helix DNA binding protein
MTYKVGPKGQVVLPKRVRERLGIAPGDEVTVEELDDEVRIRRAAPTVALRGLLSDPADQIPLTRSLELDHLWEIAHDEMRDAEWDMMRGSARPRAAESERSRESGRKGKKPTAPRPSSA